MILHFMTHRRRSCSSGWDDWSTPVATPSQVSSNVLSSSRDSSKPWRDPSRMPLSLLLVDLDRFKALNDKYGHHVGDTVIRETASLIARVTSRNAVVARTGGGDYGILDTLSMSDAMALAKKTREAVSATPILGVNVTVSIGCATAAVPGQPLFKPADEALYAAKAKGRDCVIHHYEIARRAREQHREVNLEDFENRTRVIAERVAELVTRRGRKLFEQLKEQADFDGLTGIFSRRYLDRRLAFEVEVSTERRNPLTVALLDIDNFGKVNKNHGWPTGDKVLTEVAGRIRNNTRDDDWVARYGGEEICIVMYGTPLDTARPVLERIRSAVSCQAFKTTAGHKIEVTASIGAAQRGRAEDVIALMERVSHQLLLAKRGGRNRVAT